MYTSFLLLLEVIMVLWNTSNGAFLTPNDYTLPGVMAVNGSNANGDCPTECVILSAGIRTCDCTDSNPGDEAITASVLIDGVVPTIDTSERNSADEFVWAAPLFTVRASTGSVTLGFRFQTRVVLCEVELYLFHCPAWGIGAEDIGIYNGPSFPQFIRVFDSIGRVILASDMQNCTSLTRVSIPLQMATSTSSYFIEINSLSGTIEWVHIAEVRFSDQCNSTTMAPTDPTTEVPPEMTSEDITTMSDSQPSSSLNTPFPFDSSETTFPTNTLSTSYNDIIVITSTLPLATRTMATALTPVTHSDSSETNFPTNTLSTYYDDIIFITPTPPLATRTMATALTPVTHSSIPTSISPGSPTTTSLMTLPSNAVSTTIVSPSSSSSFPVVVVGALVGVVIALFVITLIVGVVIVVCFRRRRRKTNHIETKHLVHMSKNEADGMELDTHGPRSITYNNCNYEQTHINSDTDKQLPPPASTNEGTGCTVLPEKGNISTFLPEDGAMILPDDGVDKLTMGSVNTEVNAAKSGDLESNQLIESQYSIIGHCTAEEEHVELQQIAPHETEDEVSYSLVVKKDIPTVPKKSPELYKDLKEEGGPGGEEKAMQGKVHYTPKYINADIEQDAHLDAIYDNPDAFMCENEGEGIYDTVYSESLQPSMFVKPAEHALEKEEEVKESTEVVEKEEGEGGVEDVYAPIYSLPTALESSGTVLQFKPENIHKIKTLGTGYFGKVLLADTVGLSLKELKMSETDDDKSKSVRVAVKTLRRKPKKQRQQAFNKELKFMSRLNHPNVVRTLGACMVDTPFIVMEYMEKGDLNGYLQDFDTIEQGSSPPTDLTISVGTLVSMSSQIADAMKYLASRNYIHRDLATRNCLVGPESTIKIADFGMSKNLYESHYYTIKGHVVLPVRWMAKECFYGKFSAKTDVWAFGVTMWEIFTLAKDIPYEDMDDSEVAADASRREGDRQLLQRSKDCPPEVYDVMMMCWKGEPSNRATFETLHKALLSFDV